MKQAFGLTAIPQNPAVAALKTRPFYPHVPRRFLDVKVLGVRASILHIAQCTAFRYTPWHWLFYLSPSVRRTAAASERSQPSLLPSHCPVLNEQVLLNAIGQTSIFVPSPSVDSPRAWKVNGVKKEIWFLTFFLPCKKMLWVLSSISPLWGKKMGSAGPCTGTFWLHLNGRCSWSTLFSASPKPESSCGWRTSWGGWGAATWGLSQALQGQYPEAEERTNTCVFPAASVCFLPAPQQLAGQNFFAHPLLSSFFFVPCSSFSALTSPWLQVGKNAFKNCHCAYTTSPASLSLCST